MNIRPSTGVLLTNLGTPDSPSLKDVYSYLIEFLTDSRVIDSSWLSRQLLVRGVIVPSRVRQSTQMYKEIWTEEGSPLKVYGQRVVSLLQERLGGDYAVELAMRYRSPSIESALEKLMEKGCKKVVVVPLFPQYASATTGSVHQKVMEVASKWQVIPEFDFINNFAADRGFVHALKAVAEPFSLTDYDHILFSFHGLPQRQLTKADRSDHCLKREGCCRKLTQKNQSCYSAQCYSTAAALAGALGLSEKDYSLSFQSRLGKDPWLQPYTSDVIARLASEGKKKVLVFCPAFVCDCLETIYEIGVEYANEFKHAGGEKLVLVPGLNDHPAWIDALVDIVKTR